MSSTPSYTKPQTFRGSFKLDDDKTSYAITLENTTKTNTDITTETKGDVEDFVRKIKMLVALLLKEIEDARKVIKANNAAMQEMLRGVPTKTDDIRKWANT